MNAPVWRRDLRAVALPWLASRAVVLGALGTARFLHNEGKLATTVAPPSLFEWDASFYRTIARHGYGAVAGNDGLRFFPLYPLAARLFGGSDAVLLGLASVCTLAFLVVLRMLAREWAGERAAERVVWIAAIGPGALATVMGYAEPLYLLLAAVCLLALRRATAPMIAVAGVAGALAALTRPVGVLLAVVFAVDFVRRRDWRVGVAGLGPLLGLLAFLWWSSAAGYGFSDPLRLQSKENLRGKFVDPVRALGGALHDTVVDRRIGPGMHLVWALLALVVCVVALRKLPLGPALYGTLAVLVALTSRNLDSFERYLLAAFPLYVAAAALRSTRDVDRAVLALLGAALTATSILAFTAAAIP